MPNLAVSSVLGTMPCLFAARIRRRRRGLPLSPLLTRPEGYTAYMHPALPHGNAARSRSGLIPQSSFFLRAKLETCRAVVSSWRAAPARACAPRAVHARQENPWEETDPRCAGFLPSSPLTLSPSTLALAAWRSVTYMVRRISMVDPLHLFVCEQAWPNKRKAESHVYLWTKDRHM